MLVVRSSDFELTVVEQGGTEDEVDPVPHLIGAASAGGGNPERDALYLNVVPAKNDGTMASKLDVNNVPVDGFWSISVYNVDGYFENRPCDLSVPPRRGTVPLAVWQPRPPTVTGSAAAAGGPEER
jgi:hypothetical protein